MITSQETSAMVAQQQQYYSMMGMTAPQPNVGASQYPPTFGMSHQQPGYRNRLTDGTGAMSMTASAMGGIGQGLSTAGGISGLLSAFGIGGSTIGGMMGGFLGLNPLTLGLLGAGAGASTVASPMIQANKTMAYTGQILGAHDFSNPTGVQGYGFGFNDQRRFTNSLMGEGFKNPWVNNQDQMGLLQNFQQMGMDKGVTSMGQMIDKFKEFTKMTDEVAKQLGKTVSEVTGIVGQLRGQGFYSADEVTKQTARMSAGVNYGMSMGQQGQMLSGMSTQARGYGFTGQSGAQLGTNVSQMIGSALDRGTFSEEAAMDLTGATNRVDATARMTQSLGGVFSQALTQGNMSSLLSGFVTMGDDGQLRLDEQVMSDVGSGKMDINQLQERSRSNLGQEGFQSAFRSDNKKLASDFLQSRQGVGAILGTYKSIANERSKAGQGSEEELFDIILEQQLGIGQKTSKILYEVANDIEGVMHDQLKNEARRIGDDKRRAYLARHKSWEGWKRKAGVRVDQMTYQPELAQWYTNMSSGIDAGLAEMERAYFGADMSTAGLYTEHGVGTALNKFSKGEIGAIGGGINAENRFANRGAFSIDYDKFAGYLGQGVDKGRMKALGGISVDYEQPKHWASSKETLFGGADNKRYARMLAQAERRGALTLAEQHYVIANQSDEHSSFLKQYLTDNPLDEGRVKNDNQMMLTHGTRNYWEAGLNEFGSIMKDVFIGEEFGIGDVLAAPSNTSIWGAIQAFAGYGSRAEERLAFKTGQGTVLLSRLGDKKSMKDFDKTIRKWLNKYPKDKEKAMAEAAKDLSNKYKEKFTSEDIEKALNKLEDYTGKTAVERAKDSKYDYSDALTLTGAAGEYQYTQIISEMMDSASIDVSALEGEDAQSLQTALSGNDTALASATLRDLAMQSIDGDLDLVGDSRTADALRGAEKLHGKLSKLRGHDVSAIDTMFGKKGMGAKLRDTIGKVAPGSALGAQELKEMTALLTEQQAMRVHEIDAMTGSKLPGVNAEDELFKSTQELYNATKTLTILVDNVANNGGNLPVSQSKKHLQKVTAEAEFDMFSPSTWFGG